MLFYCFLVWLLFCETHRALDVGEDGVGLAPPTSKKHREPWKHALRKRCNVRVEIE